mmetsp:Transcript_41525/g.65889  ORF Transcript_41525/g.65889 Transcript_41525/m.65889 type:complete len:209 (+) Transcript_41525:37-663(+)
MANCPSRSHGSVATASEVGSTAGETMPISIQAMGGKQFSLEISTSCTVAQLRDHVCKEMNLTKPNTVKLCQGSTSLDAGGSFVTDFGISSGSEVTAVVVLADISVTKHVYRAGGGAPPYRNGSLISTEQVTLSSGVALGDPDEWEKLIECGGYHFDEIRRVSLQGPPPLLWEDLPLEETLDSGDKRLIAEVFSNSCRVAIRARIRGMD